MICFKHMERDHHGDVSPENETPETQAQQIVERIKAFKPTLERPKFETIGLIHAQEVWPDEMTEVPKNAALLNEILGDHTIHTASFTPAELAGLAEAVKKVWDKSNQERLDVILPMMRRAL